MNTLKTGFLLATIAGIAIGLGYLFFGNEGALIGLLVAFAIQLYVYFNGANMALSSARARPLEPGEVPWLETMVAQLAQKAEIPAPPIYLSPDPQPNAFAAGRDPAHAVVCVNVGLLQRLSKNEVMAVLGHELSHVKNRDTLTMTIAAACASLISFVSHIAFWFGFGGDGRDRNPLVELLALIVAPISATLIQLAISRTREYAADEASARLMGTAQPMISALQTLENTTDQIPSRFAQTSNAHMYIASPFSGGGLANLFQTHPSMEKRIARLEEVQAHL